MLTEEEKEHVDALLYRKESLIDKRASNRAEVKRLKYELKNIADDELWEMRGDLRHDIEIGEELIEKQTLEIRGLSVSAIARKLNVDHEAVIYYQKSSTYRNKPQLLKENIDFAKAINLSVYLSKNA